MDTAEPSKAAAPEKAKPDSDEAEPSMKSQLDARG